MHQFEIAGRAGMRGNFRVGTREAKGSRRTAQMVTGPLAALMLRSGCSVVWPMVGVQVCPLANIAPPVRKA